ncbi:hypothetical protein ANRL2_00994 [Anaerolineae bacterium]|nr:hypothetical protein ANRL2_00994 [Anaerolineae bacterium]
MRSRLASPVSGHRQRMWWSGNARCPRAPSLERNRGLAVRLDRVVRLHPDAFRMPEGEPLRSNTRQTTTMPPAGEVQSWHHPSHESLPPQLPSAATRLLSSPNGTPVTLRCNQDLANDTGERPLRGLHPNPVPTTAGHSDTAPEPWPEARAVVVRSLCDPRASVVRNPMPAPLRRERIAHRPPPGRGERGQLDSQAARDTTKPKAQAAVRWSEWFGEVNPH